VPLELDHFYRATELPLLHRDPFDRLLVSQSIAEDLTIVTPDPAVQSYPAPSIW